MMAKDSARGHCTSTIGEFDLAQRSHTFGATRPQECVGLHIDGRGYPMTSTDVRQVIIEQITDRWTDKEVMVSINDWNIWIDYRFVPTNM
ncbi:hypothetical protein B0G57_1371 [Trinickia symbiotica]|nr:hypothetical protein B0G57_1371 [Trinickia symbiotica]